MKQSRQHKGAQESYTPSSQTQSGVDSQGAEDRATALTNRVVDGRNVWRVEGQLSDATYNCSSQLLEWAVILLHVRELQALCAFPR